MPGNTSVVRLHWIMGVAGLDHSIMAVHRPSNHDADRLGDDQQATENRLASRTWARVRRGDARNDDANSAG